MKCPFCKKTLNKNNGQHIYKCNKNKFNDNIKIKNIHLKYNFPYISNKNNLYNEYIINQRSFNELREEYGISYRNINFLLKYFNIKKRSKKISSEISSKKYKETCEKKYGVSNVSKLQYIKEKKGKLKYKKIIEDLDNKKKLYDWIKNQSLFGSIYNLYNNNNENIIKKEYNKLIKYHHKHWIMMNDDEKNKLVNKDSIKLESNISGILDKLNISYIKNFIIGNDFYDIRILNTDLLIDVNSDLWHANPVFYKETDILNFPFKKIKAIDIWNKENKRKNKANNNGYKIIYIWENDIKNLNYQENFDFIIKKIIDNLK